MRSNIRARIHQASDDLRDENHTIGGRRLKISNYKNYYVNNSQIQINIPSLYIAPARLVNLRISSTHRDQVSTREKFNAQTELNSHANTTVAGQNCVPIWHTERSYDMAPFYNTYKPTKDVTIVSTATGFTFTTGRQYILLFR